MTNSSEVTGLPIDSQISPENRRAVLLELFKILREEIKQSIDKQHFILIYGYSAAALLATRTEYLIAMPLVLLTMTSIWAMEVNRMVRCGFFIAYNVWPSLQAADPYLRAAFDPDGLALNWEKWVRQCETPKARFFRDWQHKYQTIVNLIIPVIFSSFAFWVCWVSKPSIALPFEYHSLLRGYAILLLISWAYVWNGVRKVSDLGAMVETNQPPIGAIGMNSP